MKNLGYVLLFTAMTAITWGAYGPLLSLGSKEMGHWLPYVFVGVAYFVIGVLASTALLAWRGEPGNWNTGGILWSFFAGIVTAVGAFCVILALTNKGSPIYVMPLVFGGCACCKYALDHVDVENPSRGRAVFLRRLDSGHRRRGHSARI